MMALSREHAERRSYRISKERFRIPIWVNKVPEISINSSAAEVAIPVIPMLGGREDDLVLIGRYNGRLIVRIVGRRFIKLVRVLKPKRTPCIRQCGRVRGCTQK